MRLGLGLGRGLVAGPGTVLDTSCSTRSRKTSRQRRSARCASGIAVPPLTVACLVRGGVLG